MALSRAHFYPSFTNTFAVVNIVNSKHNTHVCKTRSAAQRGRDTEHPAASRRSPVSDRP